MQSSLIEVKSASDIMLLRIENHSKKKLYKKCLKLIGDMKFLNAIKSIKNALKIYSINGDLIYKIKCHVLIGQYYNHLIDMKNTLMHYKKALKYCKEEFGENHPRTLSIKTIISSLTINDL